MLARMPSRLLSEWEAFFQLRHEEQQRADAVRQAQQNAASTLAKQSSAYKLAQQRGLLPESETG